MWHWYWSSAHHHQLQMTHFCVFALRQESGEITNTYINLSHSVFEMFEAKSSVRKQWKEMDLKRRSVSVPSADRLSSTIHYSLNASRCQLYYSKVAPDWRPQWGDKNGCKILLEVLGENKGEAVMDGCIWPMQGRRQRCSLPDETGSLVSWCPLCPEQPSLVRGERKLVKLLPSVLLSLVSKQMLSIFNG